MSGLLGVLYTVVGCAFVVATGWRLRDAAREPWRLDLWAMCVALFCAGVGFLAATPPMYLAIGRWTGAANVATLIVYGAITTCCMAMWAWTVSIVLPHSELASAEARRVEVRAVRGAGHRGGVGRAGRPVHPSAGARRGTPD
ncbi:hypothetical protein SAMN05421810_10944 [Amycolatopsis arida]|uniref:Uncharacterized protein n=1 Tax=Amycolatopsis arida TaxID=587909 RepID=A0A1I5ZCL7_9PSEU|nr:hypothetical protein [Amycolatopsis arida]TDX89523.1 hypothetical protein CLV69_10943 [Amycolatopsis arida]SFQ54202.1 hypothetical protein SAMN05421810_10944 [Amycolatopsis arida]